MRITKKDATTLDTLIKIEKRIYKLYKQFYKKHNQKIIETLKGLIEVEESLLKELNITDDKYDLIEEIFVFKSGIYIQDNIPVCLDPSLEYSTYPYYRILARLKYELCNQKELDFMYVMYVLILINIFIPIKNSTSIM